VAMFVFLTSLAYGGAYATFHISRWLLGE